MQLAANTEKGYKTLRKVMRSLMQMIWLELRLPQGNFPIKSEDRTTNPTMPASAVEKVAQFDFPPGHVSVSRGGRIFMDAGFHDPAATIRVIELKKRQTSSFSGGKISAAIQSSSRHLR